MPQLLRLNCRLCPGDICTLTAAVESLHLTYPGEYLTDVHTTATQLWYHNPHITRIAAVDPALRAIEMHYPSIHTCNQHPVPFLAGYTSFLAGQIGRPLACVVNRPCLYLSDAERQWTPDLDKLTAGRRRFWLICAGVKSDYTCKAWPLEHFQAVVDATAGLATWLQIGAREHRHPPLRGVIDLRGRTDHRVLIRLAYFADGGLGPITYLQHLCAAWQKPYIALVGGREPPTWCQYPLQTTLHTLGALDCCRTKACWRSRVVALKDGSDKDNSLCEHPVTTGARPAPLCLARIGPDRVIQALDPYLAP